MDPYFYEKEKREMAETQLHFVKYAAEEILEYIAMGGRIEEWYQNKLSKVHSDMEGMHSWMEGEKRRTGMVSEEAEQILEYGDTKKGQKMLDMVHSRATKNSISKKAEGDLNYAKKNLKTAYGAWKRMTDKQKFGEEVELEEGENKQVKGGDPCWKGYQMVGMKKKGGKEVPNCVPANEQYDDAPFDPPYSDRPSTVKDKSGAVHGPMSRAKHLAKMAAKRQAERMKDKPIMSTAQDKPEMHRESVQLEESRRASIVREAMKVAKDKKKKESNKTDKFEPEPELSTAINKTDV